jgi:hypothetical protein
VPTHLGDGDYLGICNAALMVRNGAPKPVVKDEEADVLAYPNPNRGQFNLKLSNFKMGKVRVEITDGRGKQVLTKETSISYFTEDISINLNSLAAGMYNVKVIGENEIKYTRIVIAR